MMAEVERKVREHYGLIEASDEPVKEKAGQVEMTLDEDLAE